ncbi:MAG: hypothetical protein AABN33_30025, partial [Acidobacteriota bacterium]
MTRCELIAGFARLAAVADHPDLSNDGFEEDGPAGLGRTLSLNGMQFNFIGHCLSRPIPIR